MSILPALDATHDPKLKSWVASANTHHDFPIQNLPLGIFSPPGGPPRAGVAIGDDILDLPATLAAGVLEEEAGRAVRAVTGATLNTLFACGAQSALRRNLSRLLAADYPDRSKLTSALHPASNCTLHLPADIGDYTDFYAGIHHATNVGRLFRPDNPLPANYKYVPLGYHGRASSICVSGTPVRRPKGQLKSPDSAAPHYAPTRRLDYELELGLWIGTGTELGETIAIDQAACHIAGFCLLNDWSARDIQTWEYQPLGPFLAKSFNTTISPWVVTPEALMPFRVPQASRPEGDPSPLPHLWDDADQHTGAYAIELDVFLHTSAMKANGQKPETISRSHTRHLYWTVAQLIAHHGSGGCNMRPGDLLGSGTISAPDSSGFGSLLETTLGGQQPLLLASGEKRLFLEDGDEIIFTGRARRNGAVSIGFGECRAHILPSHSQAI